jgi:asparagine synthase (glutamine-hydrolysing)
MCGFAGFVQLAPQLDLGAYTRIAAAMGEQVAHRGPDDSGIWIDAELGVGIAHRRLSIIDLSPTGSQPMISRDGRYVIAYNGEVYNYKDLRAEIEACEGSTSWRGTSDTEVLLAAVLRWGVLGAVQRCVGMFAFALWDRRERTLHLVRDRLGEKPLYYGMIPGWLVFASELKALENHPEWLGIVDPGAVALYLRHSYVPAPYCIYRGLSKLGSGSILSVSLERLRRHGGIQSKEDDKPPERRYWSLHGAVANGHSDPFVGDDREAIGALNMILRRSVAQQMVADVPLGAFLSGGVDSSAIVALMQAVSSRPVKTYTIGFREADYDEAQDAKAVARHLGTDHTELYLTPSEAIDIITGLPEMYDEPFADVSQIPTHLVSRLARRHVKVVLSGDGGDELFGGYKRYLWGPRIWGAIRWLTPGIRAKLAACLAPGRARPISLRGDRLAKLGELVCASDADELYYRLVSHWRHESPKRCSLTGADGQNCRLSRSG